MNRLEGKVVALTRPAERMQEAVEILEENGVVPLVAPTLELQISNTDSLIQLCEMAHELDWLIFTSPTGIISAFKHCQDLKNRLKPGCKIAVIGPRTAKFLGKNGLDADIVPEDYTAEGLLEIFNDIDVAGKKIGIPRTKAARDVLPEGLKDMGADVFLAEAYKSGLPKDKTRVNHLIKSIVSGEVDAVTFTSTLTVKNLFQLADETGKKEDIVKSMKEGVMVAAIGPVTAQPLEEENIPVMIPGEYTVEAMLQKLFDEMLQ